MQLVGMVAIIKVFKHHLPVPWQVSECESSRTYRSFKFVVFKEWFVSGQGWGQRCCIFIKVDKNKAFPAFNFELGETPVLFFKVRCSFHSGCAKESTIQAVDPLVVGACKRSAVSRVLNDLHSTVLADTWECMNFTWFISGDNDWFRVCGRAEIVAWPRDAADQTYTQPFGIKYFPLFEI